MKPITAIDFAWFHPALVACGPAGRGMDGDGTGETDRGAGDGTGPARARRAPVQQDGHRVRRRRLGLDVRGAVEPRVELPDVRERAPELRQRGRRVTSTSGSRVTTTGKDDRPTRFDLGGDRTFRRSPSTAPTARSRTTAACRSAGSTRTTPNLATTLGCRANVGTGGPSFEMPLLMAKWALAERVKTGRTPGFLRDDALLGVVMLTDEDDGSSTAEQRSRSSADPNAGPPIDWNPPDEVAVPRPAQGQPLALGRGRDRRRDRLQLELRRRHRGDPAQAVRAAGERERHPRRRCSRRSAPAT